MIVTGVHDQPLDVRALVDRIRTPAAGAVVVFEGTTRSPDDGVEIEHLTYEAWIERATSQLDALARQALRRWALLGAVAVHRVGDVPPGEPSVVCAAAAAHRAEAFEAARWLIDTLKETVAIWKKEVARGGSRWVGVDETG